MDDCHPPRRRVRRSKQRRFAAPSLALAVLVASIPVTLAQQCISLQGSSTCPAFSSASVSTSLSEQYPFLSFVSNITSFDEGLRGYIATDWARRQYQQRIGCSKVNLTNTTELYARYTTSVVCNFLVQASISPCSLTANAAQPLCADSCAQYATSEQEVASTPELCGTPGTNANAIIRADFADCSNPTEALAARSCIEAAENEVNECGYQSNLPGLCAFCGASSPNSTDSCCINANVESRCVGVHLPTTTSMAPWQPSSTAPAPSATSTGATAGSAKSGSRLSGGAIAGVVVGSLLGAALILAAVIWLCIGIKRRKQSQNGSILNTPSPSRQAHPGPPMAFHNSTLPPTVLPGARVARMSALENSPEHHYPTRTGGVLGAYHDSHDDAYESSDSHHSQYMGAPPKRDGSLSSHSVLAAADAYSSPLSGSDPDRSFSSPEGVASGQSEQLQSFKDYYSQDDIRPGDAVATLWAYSARANDEFELERGDMLKVVGIWDDGWATGVKLSESAEQWEARKQVQRDSGVSNGSRQSRGGDGNEIKAFPLVCVCLPQHWRKTIEGDSTDTAGSGGARPPPSP